MKRKGDHFFLVPDSLQIDDGVMLSSRSIWRVADMLLGLMSLKAKSSVAQQTEFTDGVAYS
jgi:hypothetical protein